MAGEAEFRKWLVSSADKTKWMVQTIETSTGAGVPDVFMCSLGNSAWAELKATPSKTKVYMRISQWRWFNSYCGKGGIGILMIKRLPLRRIDVYWMPTLLAYSMDECVLKGNDVYFPDEAQPAFSYTLGRGADMFYLRLLKLLNTGK